MISRNKLLVSLILCASCMITASSCKSSTTNEFDNFQPVTLGTLKTEKAVRGTITKTAPITAGISYDKFEIISLTRVGGTFLKFNFNQGEDVKKGDVIAEFDTSECEFALNEAKLLYKKVNNQYDSVLNNPNSTDVQKENARLAVEIEKLNVEKAQKDLDSLRIISPMDGNITFISENLVTGSKLHVNMQICAVADINSRILTLPASISDDIKLGMKVIDSENNEGEIIGIPPKNNSDSKTNSKKQNPSITISFPKEIVDKIHDSISLKVCIEEKPDVIKIPAKGVRSFNDKTYVKIKDGENKIERFVTLGVVTETEAEVISGVTEGDEIILDN